MRRVGDEATCRQLIALLRDGTDDVRRSVAYWAGDFNWSEMIEPLGGALRDPLEGVRSGAAHSLGQLDPTRAVAPLITALSDQSARVREHAAEALGKTGRQDACEVLITACEGDTNRAVRSAAVRALGAAGTAVAVPHLIKKVKALSLDDDSLYALAALEELVLRIGHNLSDDDLLAISNLKSGLYHYGRALPEGGHDFHRIECRVVVWLAQREGFRRNGSPTWMLQVPDWVGKERGSEYARQLQSRLNQGLPNHALHPTAAPLSPGGRR